VRQSFASRTPSNDAARWLACGMPAAKLVIIPSKSPFPAARAPEADADADELPPSSRAASARWPAAATVSAAASSRLASCLRSVASSGSERDRARERLARAVHVAVRLLGASQLAHRAHVGEVSTLAEQFDRVGIGARHHQRARQRDVVGRVVGAELVCLAQDRHRLRRATGIREQRAELGERGTMLGRERDRLAQRALRAARVAGRVLGTADRGQELGRARARPARGDRRERVDRTPEARLEVAELRGALADSACVDLRGALPVPARELGSSRRAARVPASSQSAASAAGRSASISIRSSAGSGSSGASWRAARRPRRAPSRSPCARCARASAIWSRRARAGGRGRVRKRSACCGLFSESWISAAASSSAGVGRASASRALGVRRDERPPGGGIAARGEHARAFGVGVAGAARARGERLALAHRHRRELPLYCPPCAEQTPLRRELDRARRARELDDRGRRRGVGADPDPGRDPRRAPRCTRVRARRAAPRRGPTRAARRSPSRRARAAARRGPPSSRSRGRSAWADPCCAAVPSAEGPASGRGATERPPLRSAFSSQRSKPRADRRERGVGLRGRDRERRPGLGARRRSEREHPTGNQPGQPRAPEQLGETGHRPG
jgi:hypothetical protein